MLNIKKDNILMDYDIEGLESKVTVLTQQYLKLWYGSKTDFPNFNKTIKFFQQCRNERKIETFRKNFSSELKKLTTSEEAKHWSYKLLAIVTDFESNIIGYENKCIDYFIEKGYANITEDFIAEVRLFDPQMDIYDIFQAIRNVWIMNSIQVLFNHRVDLSPSIFAYSMLYPYSDNYLDDASVKMEEKIDFNNRFRKWLQGESLEPRNINEEKIYELIKKIEGQFPREEYPQVFSSLLAIHSAQVKSLQQQRGNTLPNEKDIIGITFEKGGTSVLADGYLTKGILSDEEASFLFGYGVFLQIIDDLQDVKEDYKNGHMTIFSQIAYKWPLDLLVNKLFWFIEEMLTELSILDSPDSIKIKKVIYESCYIMILEAIAKNKNLFSKKYIRKIQQYSMLRFSYFMKIKKRFSKSFSSNELKLICNVLGEEKDRKRSEVII